MTFQIETGIPIPPQKGGKPRCYQQKSPVAIALDALEVSQSFLMDQHDDYMKSRGLFSKYLDRRYVTRKTGEGWRIWRVK